MNVKNVKKLNKTNKIVSFLATDLNLDSDKDHLQITTPHPLALYSL